MRKLSYILMLGFGLALLGCSTTQTGVSSDNHTVQEVQKAQEKFEKTTLVQAVSEHLGVTSESAASVIERLFREQGRPVGYITGTERSAALVGGAFYGEGTLWMKNGSSMPMYWQGPTVGFDTGVDASKVFTLVYNLNDPNYIFQRFPKAEGSAYLVAGMAVNYQRANGIVLAPIRTGVGIRLGANVGYSSYTRKRSIIPL